MAKLEEYIERFENGEDPTRLMDEMERQYKIPAMNSEEYNARHPEIMALYRAVSASRSSIVGGMDKLSTKQRACVIRAHRAHTRAVWPENRHKYELAEVWIDEQGTTCARLTGGDWFHYYQDGTWG